ncbi:MAG: transglycosylase SLT domain-containing protein [Candidatus Delongbacteria bacterium]|nr:transglycosylase SLT domain-containing protein [Candidatus Delongbacteria bacterium]
MSVLKNFTITALILLSLNSIFAAGYRMPEEIRFAGKTVPVEKFDTEIRLEKNFNILVNDRRGFIQNLINEKDEFIPFASEILTQYDVHPDFAYIIPVESEFNTRAYSKAGASGPWQLMAATARMYGLRVDSYCDERNLLNKSTEATAEHLMMLSGIFNNDPFLTLAAYNNGDMNVRTVLESQRSEDFWDIRSNTETESYVEKVIIYKMILENPGEFGFREPPKKKKREYETCVVSLGPSDLEFTYICEITGMNYREFYTVNPHINFGSYKTGGYINKYTSMEIVVPEGRSEILLSVLRENEVTADGIGVLLDIYEVKYNDRIESIAFKYGVDWRELSTINDLEIITLPSGNETAKIYQGQKIRIVK